MRIVFSILHYKTKDVTEACINSILSLDKNGNEIFVLVIDNYSQNGTGEILADKYLNNPEVFVLLNKRNLGFAKGNNLGFNYAKRNFNPDIIIVLNNDTLITQCNFIKILEDIINENNKCMIIAPNIINKIGVHQNPVRDCKISLSHIFFVLFYNVFIFIVMHIPVLKRIVLTYLEKYHERKKCTKTMNEVHEKYLWNIVPHGAAIMYMKEYINREDCAFNPNTFLYCEEELLYEYAMKKHYDILFCNDLYIQHMEDVSTNSITQNVSKRKAFIARHKIHSAFILLKSRLFSQKDWKCEID